MGHSGEKQPAMTTFEATRPAVGAQALGIARAAYEFALDYAKERKAFGKPIVMHQAIAFKLANMAVEIDAARLLIWRAAWLARNGGFKNGEGSMSKYKASEVAVRVTEDAIQILGGYGYTREYPVERWHRDAKIHTIFEGTSRDPAAGDRQSDLRHAHRVTQVDRRAGVGRDFGIPGRIFAPKQADRARFRAFPGVFPRPSDGSVQRILSDVVI